MAPPTLVDFRLRCHRIDPTLAAFSPTARRSFMARTMARRTRGRAVTAVDSCDLWAVSRLVQDIRRAAAPCLSGFARLMCGVPAQGGPITRTESYQSTGVAIQGLIRSPSIGTWMGHIA
jgi:hypothetical protein